jgi:glycosyltransferase involved in cell wall biosynthesis
MKVLFDHQIFTMQKYGGISQYFAELYKRLPEDSTRISMRYSRNEYLNQITGLTFPIVNLPSQKYMEMVGYYLIDYLNQRNILYNLKHFEFDVFHPTYYNPHFLKYLRGKPYVLTVFDMAHERYPEQFGDSAMVIRNKKLTIENATELIALSQATKDDMLQYYDIDPDKITVIHLATSLTPITNLVQPTFRYVLFVGSRAARYKGFYEFATATSQLLREDKTLHVICAGGGPFTNEEICMFYPDIQSRVHQTFFKNNEDLARLYQRAEAFVFPSWCEGFGIPQLEAMTCSCPMACSDISVFHEIAGDAAEYFEVRNPRSVRFAITRAIENKLVGKERAKGFSWDKMAEETMRVYNKVKEETQ